MTDAALEAFSNMDTQRQYRILVNASALDTEAGDKLLGTLAGMYPERYRALRDALDRAAVNA